MVVKSVAPSTNEMAFDCPHCGAYTSHTWYEVFAEAMAGEKRFPIKPDPNILENIAKMKDLDAETKDRFSAYFENILRGLVVLDRNESGRYVYTTVGNVHLSRCFTCRDVSVWVNHQVLFPQAIQGPSPNPDLPTNVADDYTEAGRILTLSPRGAAALLRLAIQKLCAHLGEKGKNIDDDIASLVAKGLSPIVQQSLDAVRVIGNEAVHPGTLDLKDDVDTAAGLFALVNIIAEQLISNPKHVREAYDKLPEAKRKAIETRDAK